MESMTGHGVRIWRLLVKFPMVHACTVEGMGGRDHGYVFMRLGYDKLCVLSSDGDGNTPNNTTTENGLSSKHG